MLNRGTARRSFGAEEGSVLVMVAAALVMLLGVCAIAIDMANLYLARAQAQRAADAAAMAGAKSFLTTGCATSGCTAGGVQETGGRQQAEAAGAQNYIAGRPASIADSDITFSYPNALEPQITVVAKATVSTFFAKIFGIRTSNVRATATAEAYNPAGGGGAPLAAACLKPFLVPNCDPTNASPVNSSCQSGSGKGKGGGGTSSAGYFFDPTTGAIAHPGTYPSGVIGMPWTLHSVAGPSQWYLVGFGGAPPSSGSALRNHIKECTPAPLSCGDTLQTANGKILGPTNQGTNALINANGDRLNQGQDSIDTTIGPPFAITGGANNPNPALVGKTFFDYSQSPSVVTVPVYTGNSLPPGGTTVSIIGYMQVFIKDANHNTNSDDIDVVILNISSCGGAPPGGGPSGTPPIIAAAGSPVPIRLIRTN
ncbi:MAG TPA: pilus assembly protein TadG-related protein [Terriglobia bacterium]|nr:pilus assembly protein TadG-related protein [Terriglobia bacterium]